MKRFIALVLSLVMALSLCAPAWGVGESTKLPEAVNGVITLTEDVKLAEAFEVAEGTTLKIDLNGYAITGITGRDADNNRVHVIVNNGNLTVKNGTVNSAGYDGGSAIYNNAGATLTIEDVTLYGAPQSDPVYEAGVSKPYPSYAVNNYGNAEINGATIKSYHGAIATGDNGVTVINDADIDVGLGQSTGITSYLIYSYGDAKVTVNDGEFAFTKKEIYVNGGNTFCELGTNPIIVNGGNYTGTSFSTGEGREYVIKGGTFDADPTKYVAEGYKVTESNGTYTVEIDLPAAIASAAAVGGTVTLPAGNYVMPDSLNGAGADLHGKTLTIKGTKDTVIDVSAVSTNDQFVTGATLKFEGVTLKFNESDPNKLYMGFANVASLTYKDCKITGLQILMGEEVTFENCVIDSSANTMGQPHSVWTYGAKNVSFTNCEIIYGGRAVNCYKDQDIDGGKQVVNFTDCTFTTKDANAEGAVEINSTPFSVGIEVNLTDCVAPAYGKMAYVSQWDSTNGAKTTINEKYTVSFDANGGTKTMEPVIAPVGDFTLPECTFTAPTNKKFAGWALTAAGEVLDDTYELTEKTTFYAIWEDITYTVSFAGNGGTGTMAPVTVVINNKYELPANPFTAPEGKQFKAWSVDSAEYAAGEKITVAADVTVTAVWVDAPVKVENEDVMVQVAPPVVTVDPELEKVLEEDADKAAIVENVEVSEICTDAMSEVVAEVAKQDETVVTETQVAKLDELLGTQAEPVEKEDVVVVVQTNFEVAITDVEVVKDAETNEVTSANVVLNITPVYQKVLTTQDVVGGNDKVEVGKNAVAIEDEDATGELDLKGKEVEITIAIPDVLVDLAVDKDGKKVLYVNHTKDDKVKTTFVYEAEVNVTEKTATFFNPNGFSSFTLSATNSTVAYVEESGMNYASIESAISDAGKGAVIEVLVSDQVVNITAPCSFKLKWADNITEPTFNVAKGYTMSKWYVNGVHTYIVQSASAGGYAPSTTPEKVVTSADTFDAGIALYVGMSVMAAAGSAVVLKKRED